MRYAICRRPMPNANADKRQDILIDISIGGFNSKGGDSLFLNAELACEVDGDGGAMRHAPYRHRT